MIKNIINIGERDPDVPLPNYAELEALIRGIYDGDITLETLPNSLYLFNFYALIQQLLENYGLPTDFEPGTRQRRIANIAKRNLSFFSGAKTFQNVLDLSVEVFDENNQIRPLSEFRQIALSINDKYNVNWLRTEQNAAVRQSQSIDAWQTIQDDSDLFPLLKYSTVGDPRVRPDHVDLDGIVRRFDDNFWNTWFPPNGYNCRCIVDQIEEGDEPITNIDNLDIDPNDSIFNTNVGKTGFIFPNTHPYNEVPSQFQEAKDSNFGFSIPTDADIKDFFND